MQKEFPYFDKRALRPPLVLKPINSSTVGIVTIPVYAEEELILTLESLGKCAPPTGPFEVIMLINHSILASKSKKDINYRIESATKNWIEKNHFDHLQFHLLTEYALEDKKAGVGTARKILMDEASRRLTSVGMFQAPIIGLDADCLVQDNYLVEIENYFRKHEAINACSINFEHRLDGLSQVQKLAITRYEKHLRYYISAQRMVGFPFAYQTIGSAMAVRCLDYMEQGGMNRRKAGEDFYFLQKFIELGNFGEMDGTTVYPSGRVSDRVPFGTGKAVQDALEIDGLVTTYHIQSFKDIKVLFDRVDSLYKMSEEDIQQFLATLALSVTRFLYTIDFEKKIKGIKSNTSSESAFVKRFFRWFNAFQLMKFLHFARDNFYPNQPVEKMVKELRKWQIAE